MTVVCVGKRGWKFPEFGSLCILIICIQNPIARGYNFGYRIPACHLVNHLTGSR